MKPIQHILYPTDLSLAAKPAFNEAIVLARHSGATIHMLHVAPAFGEDPLRNAFRAAVDEDEFYRELRDEMDERMKALIEVQGVNDLPIKRVHSRGAATGQVILEYAVNQNIDLIVMGTHGNRGLRRMVLGSVTVDVVRNAPCDIITVRNVTGISNRTLPMKRILVPIDLTPYSRVLLAEARDIAERFGGTLVVMHSIEPAPIPTWPVGSKALNEMIPSLKVYVQEQLVETVNEALGPDARVESVLREGKAAKEIVRYADETECDMIVMAPRDTGWLDHLPLGSVAERVMASSNLPVYMVHVTENRLKTGAAHHTGANKEAY